MKLSKAALARIAKGQLPEPSEAEFAKQVIALAQAHGWRVAHFRGVCVKRKNGSTYWQTPVQADGAGFPDLICVHEVRRLLVVAELKVGRNEPTAEQWEWIHGFCAVQGVVAKVWRPDDWQEIERTFGD